jgi:hypothetical protein
MKPPWSSCMGGFGSIDMFGPVIGLLAESQ